MLIKDITAKTTNGWSKVETIIAGKPLWFESQDTQLSANAEAFASALLFPALLHNQRLQFEMPLSLQWLEGAQKLVSIFNDWWNYPIIIPEGTGEHVVTGGSDRTLRLWKWTNGRPGEQPATTTTRPTATTAMYAQAFIVSLL